MRLGTLSEWKADLVHLKDLDDRHEAWQMIARPATRQKAAGQRHDSITETSFDGGAPVILHPTRSQCPSPLFFFLTYCFTCQAELRTAGILDARLGRDTQTREPLGAATSPLLMTFPPTWLARDGPRI
jgi:hypothetical protein